jgi:hypothetical protein
MASKLRRCTAEVCAEVGQVGGMKSYTRVARADDQLMNITQRAWEPSRHILHSPGVRDPGAGGGRGEGP